MRGIWELLSTDPDIKALYMLVSREIAVVVLGLLLLGIRNVTAWLAEKQSSRSLGMPTNSDDILSRPEDPQSQAGGSIISPSLQPSGSSPTGPTNDSGADL